MKAFLAGVILLAVSALNVYLPDVGNLLDTRRIGFSFAAFLVGWVLVIKGLAETTD